MGAINTNNMALLSVALSAILLLAAASAEVQWWQTAQGTSDRLAQQSSSPTPEPGAPPGSWTGLTIQIDLTQPQQEILGFGAAFTQASASVFQELSQDAQKRVMELYFDPEKGINYNVGRVPINSCDFSPKVYSLDDMAGDFNLTWFDSTLRDDTQTMIPLINAALAVPGSSMAGGKLFGSPWSPPAWMKSNADMLNGGTLLDEARDSWSLYLSKWVSEYNKKLNNLSIWGITVQNEPEAKQPWESCQYTPDSQRSFIQSSLGPRMRQDHPDLKIMGFDHNKDNLVKWADSLLSPGAGSENYVDGIAFHWYAGSCFENVQTVSQKYPNKFFLASEATYELSVVGPATPEFVRFGNWSRGEGYAFDILGDLRSGSSGWVDWNLLLNQNGGPNHVGNDCDATILVNTSSNELYIHPQYWYLGHFSRFVPAGAVKVASTPALQTTGDCTGYPAYGMCTSNDLQHVAFVKDAKIVVVVLNCADTNTEFVLSYGAWFQSKAPAHSIQTYVFDKP